MEPAELEAKGIDTIDVKFMDETFTFPATMDSAPIAVLVALDDQKFSHVIRGIMSPDDWEKFVAIPGLTIADAGKLFDEYAKQSGINAGE